MRRKRTDICLSSGDAEYFQTFFTANKRRLVLLVRRMGVPESDVGDVTQDVLERLMKNIPALRKFETEPGKQLYYVRQAVQSICADRYRRIAKTPCDTYAPEELDELAGLQMSEESIDPLQLKEDILHAKNLMTEQEWLLVSGKYMIGYSDEELAKMFGYTKDSVRTIIARAIKKARAADKKRGGESNGPKNK